MELEYSKKDMKKSPKQKKVSNVFFDRGFWRFEGSPIGYATEEKAKQAAEAFLSR
jgi:hypothetical protein